MNVLKHNFSRKPVSELKVVAGQLSTTNPDVNEQTIDVDSVTIFPEFNSTDKLNDIALINVNIEGVHLIDF
jgi:hypothetical protein